MIPPIVGCLLRTVFGVTFLPLAARAYRAMTTARVHRAMTTARAYRAMTTARAYRALTAARAYRALTTARVHRALTAARVHRAMTTARAYRVLTATRAYRVLTTARAHRVLTATRAYRALTAARAYRVLTATRSRVSLPMSFGWFGADQREARRARKLALWFSFGERFWFWAYPLDLATRQITDQREAPTPADHAMRPWIPGRSLRLARCIASAASVSL